MVSLTSKGQSVVVQKVDTLSQDRITNIETHLTSFYKANKTSQLFIFAGPIISLVGILMYKPTSNEPNLLPFIGGACSVIGGVIYLDSYKYLNFDRKTRLQIERKKGTKKTAEDYYW